MRALVLTALVLALAGCSADLPSANLPARVKPAPTPGVDVPPPPLDVSGRFCTADVQACPDGSFVSRNPDKGCAFNACPGTVTP
jgi:hypothetical protein